MPPDDPEPPSLTHAQASQLLTHFATFLTIALHTLLYHRSLYPEGTFLAARAYGLPVRQSRHEGVCRWVADAVDAVVAQLREAAVERVVFVVYEKNVTAPALAPAPPVRAAPRVAPTSAFAVKSGDEKQKKEIRQKKEARVKKKPRGGGGQKSFAVLERWIFDVSNFPVWPAEEAEEEGNEGKDKEVEAEGEEQEEEEKGEEKKDKEEEEEEEEEEDDEEFEDDEAEEEEDLIWDDVNESLRGALGRLASAAETMPHLPDGCPFTLAIELRSEAPPPIDVSCTLLRRSSHLSNTAIAPSIVDSVATTSPTP